jgi:hypothetical protein
LIGLILAIGAAADEVEVLLVDGDLRPGRASIVEVGALGADGTPRGDPVPLDLIGATIRGPVPHRAGVWRYVIVPAIDADEVVVSGVGVPRTFPSVPPPPSSLLVPESVDATAGSSPVVLHVGCRETLPVDALEIATSEGSITDVRETDGGIDVTVTPGDHPVPRWMLVGVRDRRRDEQPAWIPVRLVARPRLPFEAEPGATLVLEVGGRRYGPFTADAHGHVETRLDQYPGDRLAIAVLTDDLGNATRTEVPLVSQADPVLVLSRAGEPLPGRPPPVLHVKAIEPSGGVPAGPLSCRTPAAKLPVREASPGAWFVPLPPTDSPEDVRVVCTLGTATASARLTVAAGVAASLELRVWPEDLRADFPVAEVRYALEDLRGERLPLDRVEVTAALGRVVLEPHDGFVGRGEYEGRDAVTAGTDTIRAAWRAPRGEGQVEELRLAWAPESSGRLRVSARAVDRLRRPLPDVVVQLAAGDHAVDATTGPNGWATAVVDRRGRGLTVLRASTVYRTVQAIVAPGDPGIDGPDLPDLVVTQEVVLLPGRVAGISLDIDPELLRAGPGAVAWVTVKLADGAGQPVTDEPIELEASEGDIGALQGRPDGSFVAEYTPLPSERQRDVTITARTGSLFTSARLQLEPRVVRLSFGPWFGVTTNFGTITRPIGGIDLDIRTRSKLTGESLMVRIGVAGTWFQQDVQVVNQTQEWTSTLVPITAGLLFRDDRGPIGLWAGGGIEAIAHQLSVSTAAGEDLADGLNMHFGPVVFTGASHRALGGEVLLALRASWVPVSEAGIGFDGNLGGLVAGVGYRLVY